MHLKENSESLFDMNILSSEKQTHKYGDFKPKSGMKLRSMTLWDGYKVEMKKLSKVYNDWLLQLEFPEVRRWVKSVIWVKTYFSIINYAIKKCKVLTNITIKL